MKSNFILILGLFVLFVTGCNNSNTTAPVVPQFPIEIKLALNTLKSSVTTGISLSDYTNQVIALKTAIATYGDNLTPKQKDALFLIVRDCNNSIQIWKLSKKDDSGVDVINIDDDTAREMYWLKNYFKELNITSAAMLNDNSYYTESVLNQIWKHVNSKIDELLAN